MGGWIASSPTMICEREAVFVSEPLLCERLMLIFIYIMFAQVPIANTFNGPAKILAARLKRSLLHTWKMLC
jgi:hypothetical protein